VEEEYLLLDPVTGSPVPVAERVLAEAGRGNAGGADLQPELVRAQVEIATPVCHELDEVQEALTAARNRLAAAAAGAGVVLAPLGAAPVDAPGTVPVTAKDRYRAIADQSPAVVAEHLVNGMHVHVGVPGRATGVTVLNRLRAWLHVLLALSANSPMWHGADTGFASWRGVHALRWGAAGPPPAFADAHDYDRRVDALVATGAVLDRAQLYWTMRLAERYETVEVRVCDVQLDPGTATMLAGLVRGIAARALADAGDGFPEPVLDPELVWAASWQAAREGCAGELVDLTAPRAPRLRPAEDVVAGLLDHIAPHTVLEPVLPALAGTLLGGGGAGGQRRAFARAGVPGLLELLRAHVLPVPAEEGARQSPAAPGQPSRARPESSRTAVANAADRRS
jgi:carboxylate-amine ligase